MYNLTDSEYKNLANEISNFSPADELELRAIELWCYYYATCENFDQVVCSGRNERGIAVPVGWDEQKAINKNALTTNKHICARANDIGISPEMWENAKKIACTMSYAENHEFACNVSGYVASSYKGK